ncbi:glycosyltransferase family 4 protein [Candidatus Cyanaurora vandensis]|uniref:glycosyltransferase family 4 protein n=1 Tax=Candidatus Cyanaurora vandensis TaxID=2714958 RepID=UPI00257E7CE3|nr:glycosyltransferase family 4 protein [Candidatus Cyanaurora vandensis]
MQTKTPTKPRICFALPGINYIAHSPRCLSTLPILQHLSQDFEVTLVFRSLLEEQGLPCRTLTILDRPDPTANSNGYFTPLDPQAAWDYGQQIQRFAADHRGQFDLVIEKEWHLLGLFAQAFRRQGVAGLAIHHAEFTQSPGQWRGLGILKNLPTILFRRWLPELRRGWVRGCQGVITETTQMQHFLRESGYLAPTTPIYAIPNGIDPQIFHPQDQATARARLGLPQDQYILTYVGSLNRYIQEPGPLIEALGQIQPKGVVLHIIGDGSKRGELEALARAHQAPVTFWGRVPQAEVAHYIAAADLCVAPYRRELFQGGELTVASLKVPEYLAAARPVLTLPSPRMAELLAEGPRGFLVENTTPDYCQFLKNPPPRAQLQQMAQRIAAQPDLIPTWQQVAQRYQAAIQPHLPLLAGSATPN